MSGESDARLQAVDRATLTPVVRRALQSSAIEVLDWHHRSLLGGMDTGSIYRFAGTADDSGTVVPWSLVLKIIPPSDGVWTTENREALAYQSGHLETLPGGLSAPRCWGVTEQAAGDVWLWLEEISDEEGPQWPLEQFGRAARHLGRFNGAYLGAHASPQWSWLSWLLPKWLTQEDTAMDLLRDSLEHPLVRRQWPPDIANRTFRLWVDADTFLSALRHLPTTICHYDAIRRNLFARRTRDQEEGIVAIDWAFVCRAALGEEIVPLVVGTLAFGDASMEGAAELDAIVFDAYVQGLRDAGWDGDPRLVRLGYTAGAALRFGIVHTQFLLDAILDPHQVASIAPAAEYESVPEAYGEHLASVRRFVLGLADEARGLIDSLQA